MGMNPEVKAKWLAALRSGEYTKQEGSLFAKAGDYGYGVVLEKDCYCALGVLAEEAAKEGVVTVDETATGNDRFGEIPDYRLLPEPVADWAEFGNYEDAEAEVAKLNDRGLDSHKSTFEDVANWVEENL